MFWMGNYICDIDCLCGKNNVERESFMEKNKIRRNFLAAGIMVFLSTGGFLACGKEKIEPGTPLQEVMVQYEMEGTLKSVAALKDGTTFTITASREEKPSILQGSMKTFFSVCLRFIQILVRLMKYAISGLILLRRKSLCC